LRRGRRTDRTAGVRERLPRVRIRVDSGAELQVSVSRGVRIFVRDSFEDTSNYHSAAMAMPQIAIAHRVQLVFRETDEGG
jgi:hypothetical protein